MVQGCAGQFAQHLLVVRRDPFGVDQPASSTVTREKFD
jgi:hypothetical protein